MEIYHVLLSKLKWSETWIVKKLTSDYNSSMVQKIEEYLLVLLWRSLFSFYHLCRNFTLSIPWVFHVFNVVMWLSNSCLIDLSFNNYILDPLSEYFQTFSLLGLLLRAALPLFCLQPWPWTMDDVRWQYCEGTIYLTITIVSRCPFFRVYLIRLSWTRLLVAGVMSFQCAKEGTYNPKSFFTKL